MSAVRRRCTLTWSLSATSTPESPPPPAVSLPSPNDRGVTQLTMGYRLDLQVRWYRQAYYREVREGTASLFFHSTTRDPSGASSERAATFWLIVMRGIFGLVGLCEVLRASARPHVAFANCNTMTHMQFSHFGCSMLTSLSGSRRAR
jgi:hypothetical protein